MFNPFFPFHAKMIERLLQMGHRYLVSQTYLGYTDHFGGKEMILLTDYDKENIAKVHLNAVAADKYHALLDLENKRHREKLMEMLEPTSRYKLLSAFLADKAGAERQLKEKFSQQIREYVRKRTYWKIEGNETLHVNLEVIFGDLYLVLRFQQFQSRIKLVDLEKFK